MALIGESGKEAVMPLQNNTGWIKDLAKQIANQNANQKQPVQQGDQYTFQIDSVQVNANDGRSFAQSLRSLTNSFYKK